MCTVMWTCAYACMIYTLHSALALTDILSSFFDPIFLFLSFFFSARERSFSRNYWFVWVHWGTSWISCQSFGFPWLCCTGISIFWLWRPARETSRDRLGLFWRSCQLPTSSPQGIENTFHLILWSHRKDKVQMSGLVCAILGRAQFTL